MEKAAAKARSASSNESVHHSFAHVCDWGRVRLWIVGGFFCLLWLGLWARAYHLQINMGPEYAAMARRQHTAKEVVQGVRGNILDRQGNIMARSVECSSIWVNPAQIQDRQEAALKLGKALRMPAKTARALLDEKKTFVWLARKVDYHSAEAVRALNLPGVYLDSEYERIYPYKHLAGQLIGFVNIDDNGIEGLEKSLERQLAGRSVTRMVERDAAGRRLVPLGAGGIADLRGKDVRLTIDTQVQFFAEESLAEYVDKFGARWGGCIVVDVPTGDILAWAQYPFFDPNNVAATIQAHRKNRLAADMLEQGSTIKSFLVAAALEEKVVKPSTEIFCENGQWKFRRFTLHDTHSYGKLTVDKILHVSSNIGAAKIGLMLGAAKYYDYLTRIGFGVSTRLPLAGEARGILRNARRWADIDLATASFGQSFSATMAQMAQAYLCLAGNGEKTPLRLVIEQTPFPYGQDDAMPGNASSSGGSDAGTSESTQRSAADTAGKAYAAALPPVKNTRTAPTASSRKDDAKTAAQAAAKVEQSPGPDADAPSSATGALSSSSAAAKGGADKIFSSETLRTVRAMLREVVEEEGGTGKLARIPGIEVGGKTGTAQKADGNGRYGSGRVGSFVGMVPIENPRYLICVLLDEPTKSQYGGIVAAPVFRDVALQTMAYHGRLPDADDPVLRAAAQKEEERKAKMQGKKEGERKAAALPKKKEEGKSESAKKGTAAGTETTLPNISASAAPLGAQKAATDPAAVPAVVGMGLRNAVEAFATRGFMPAIKGKGGIVVRQSPEPGSPWPEKGQECTLWLEESAS